MTIESHPFADISPAAAAQPRFSRSPVVARVWRAALVATALQGGAAAVALAQGVATYTLQSSRAVASAEFDGVVQPVKQSVISAQASGRVASLLVKAGDRVKSGQLLATIDDRDAMAGLQKSQAGINQAEADLRNARAQLERTRDLQGRGFVSKAALDVADAVHSSAQAQRDQAIASMRQSSLAQGFTRVTAPFDGWVSQTSAEAGELAVPGKPLLTLYAPLPLRVVVQVPASRAALMRDAASVQVIAGEAGGEAVSGGGVHSITPISRTGVPAADPVSQTTEWRLELPDAQSTGLLPGQQVRVRLSGAAAGTATTALTVPEAAVVRRGELTAVYVASGNTFVLRAVRLGRSRTAGAGLAGSGQSVDVLAGLKSGERVALDPLAAASGATPVATGATPAK